jgi:tRNA (guanine6-N2)-methyltransferase
MAELRERLGDIRSPRMVPERNDSITFTYAGEWSRLLTLRTAVAAFVVLDFAVPRPKSLGSGEHLNRLARTLTDIRRANAARPPGSFRFDAAGRDSTVFRQLGAQLSEATGLRFEAAEGDLVLRFRRSLSLPDGWDVLCRMSTRPLSDRPWRVRNFPGAANATVAAAVARLTDPRPSDRVANLMCGSGTLLIERLLAAPARSAFGIDADKEVLGSCLANLSAAGLNKAARLHHGAIEDADWPDNGPFDVILADPPWGGLVGRHRTNESLHLTLLERAHSVAAPGARLAVLTHEIKQMERCLKRTQHLWEAENVTRVFQKGHHPRIYVLRSLTERRG